MTTAGAFAPAFFRALAQHGVVDRAMATARRAVRERPTGGFPSSSPGCAPAEPTTSRSSPSEPTTRGGRWGCRLRTGNFTPVLGPGLADSILGSRQDIARRWVKRWQMPLASHNQGDLAQVAQYLRVRSADTTVRASRSTIWAKRSPGDPKPPSLATRSGTCRLTAEARGARSPRSGRRLRKTDPGDPYRVAAALPVSVYVTTACDRSVAGRAARRRPAARPGHDDVSVERDRRR